MSNYNALLNTIKKASVEAVEAANPVKVCFGKVTSEVPLKILVEQKITLTEAQLILTSTMKHTALIVNQNVLMLRMQGGQKYILIDRLDND